MVRRALMVLFAILILLGFFLLIKLDVWYAEQRGAMPEPPPVESEP